MHKIEQILWDFKHLNYNIVHMVTVTCNYMYLYIFFQLETGISLKQDYLEDRLKNRYYSNYKCNIF